MEDRTTDLEVKVAWLENYVSELDAVVRTLGDEVAALREEVARLRAARAEAGDQPPGEQEARLSYEIPPHY